MSKKLFKLVTIPIILSLLYLIVSCHTTTSKTSSNEDEEILEDLVHYNTIYSSSIKSEDGKEENLWGVRFTSNNLIIIVNSNFIDDEENEVSQMSLAESTVKVSKLNYSTEPKGFHSLSINFVAQRHSFFSMGELIDEGEDNDDDNTYIIGFSVSEDKNTIKMRLPPDNSEITLTISKKEQ